jgi:hypothetical protein
MDGRRFDVDESNPFLKTFSIIKELKMRSMELSNSRESKSFTRIVR